MLKGDIYKYYFCFYYFEKKGPSADSAIFHSQRLSSPAVEREALSRAFQKFQMVKNYQY